MDKNTSNSNIVDLDLIKTSLENVWYCSDIEIKSFEFEKISKDGENYCSDIYEIKTKYFQNSQNSKESNFKELSFVVKYLPKEKQKILHRLGIYYREQYFYRNIIAKLELLMNLCGNKKWLLGPKLYYHTSKPMDTLVFENLCSLGFRLENRQNGLDFEHSSMVLKKLAEYHSLTMVLQENTTSNADSLDQRYSFGLLNTESIHSESFKALFSAQLLKFIEILKMDKNYLEICRKLEKYYENFVERVQQSVYPLKGQWNVLNHGDLWVNNFLFLYENDKSSKCEADKSTRPKEVRFIDFQLCFYGSLGFDINYFLNTSVQLDVLRNQRDALIQIYTDALLSTLQKYSFCFGQQLPTVTEIRSEINAKELYGFFVAFAFFPLMSMQTKDSSDNSLENLINRQKAEEKIQFMFTSNQRTMETLKYIVKRLEQLKIL